MRSCIFGASHLNSGRFGHELACLCVEKYVWYFENCLLKGFSTQGGGQGRNMRARCSAATPFPPHFSVLAPPFPAGRVLRAPRWVVGRLAARMSSRPFFTRVKPATSELSRTHLKRTSVKTELHQKASHLMVFQDC